MANSWSKIKNLVIGLKELSTVGSANTVAALISGIFWFYVANLLGAEEFGKVSYFIAIATIASFISYLGAGNTVVVYTAKEKKIQASVYFVAIISSGITSIILFFIFYNLGASLLVIGNVIFGLVISEVLGRKLYKDFSKYILTQRILLVGLSIGLYYLLGPDGIILGFALSFFPFVIRIYNGLRASKIDMHIIKSRSGFMMNSYALDLSNVFATSVDKLIILPLFGFALLGNYQLGAQLLVILYILPQSVYQYTLTKDASGITSGKLKNVTILVSVVFATLVVLLSPLVIPMLFSQFQEAVMIIQIMSLAIVPLTINSMYVSKLLGMEKSRIVLFASIINVVVQVLGIVILGHFYGIIGASMALVLGATAQTIYLVNVIRKLK